jgi:hypothetical protein
MGSLGRLREVSRWHEAPQHVAGGKDVEIVIEPGIWGVVRSSHLTFAGSKHLAARAYWAARNWLLGQSYGGWLMSSKEALIA